MGTYHDRYTICKDHPKDCEMSCFPLFANEIAKCWEDERRMCYEGEILHGCCSGVKLRFARTAVTALDMAVSAVSCPVVAIGGPVISCLACTTGTVVKAVAC